MSSRSHEDDVGMDLYDVMRTTGAVRQFTGDPLSDEVLERILDNARFAPSGGNRQGVHVIAVRDQPTRDRLAELSRPAARRYAAQLANGESPWNPVHPIGVDAATVEATEPPALMTDSLREASVVLVICLDLGVVAATDQGLDRIGVVPGASVYPFVWNVLLAARSEGYGGVTNTMAIAQEPQVKALLGIPDGHAVAALIPLGKPVHQVSKLKRKPVAEFVTRERFDGDPL
jgi:nitroreductase